MKEQEREDGEWCVEVQRGSGDQGRISEGEGGTEDATLGGTGEDRKSSHPLTFSTYGTIRTIFLAPWYRHNNSKT